MKTIKVHFCDFYADFNKENNHILNILKKHYIVVSNSSEPDFLIYSCSGEEHRAYQDKKCIKIFYSGEIVHPDFNVCDYAIGHDYLSFEGRYFRFRKYVKKNINISDNDLLNRKFCNFIYNNDSSGDGARIRQEFCQQLMKYRMVDCPGRVLNNMKNAISPRWGGDWWTGKVQFLKDYKFTIAFENVSSPGYITEKLIHPFTANSIPVYWGDPYVSREFNPKSFINCHDFPNFEEVIEYIKYLDTNDMAYLEMIHQPAMQDSYNPAEHNLEEFLLRIIERGFLPQSKDDRRIWSLSSHINMVLNFLKREVFSKAVSDTHKNNLEDIWRKIECLTFEQDVYRKLYGILTNNYDETLYSFLKIYNKVDNSNNTQIQRYNTLISSIGRILKNGKITIDDSDNIVHFYRLLLSLVRPFNVLENKKIRIGGNNVGGLVMLDYKLQGVVHALNGTWMLPWNKEMESRGCTVHRHEQNVISVNTFLEQIFPDKNYIKNNEDIILHIDARGREWEFFEQITKEQLNCFSQIVVSFYNLANLESAKKAYTIFRKIQETHQVIHIHYHNHPDHPVLCFHDFLIPNIMELTFVRRNDHTFVPSDEEYPTPLDAPVVPSMPDLYIGRFDVITGKKVIEKQETVQSSDFSSCFKSYDIRGKVPQPLNASVARALGQALAEFTVSRKARPVQQGSRKYAKFSPCKAVIGRDARLSGPELRDALIAGLRSGGVQVSDLGLCGTEEIYYAAAHQPFDVGLMITGSHNPADENGLKIVRAGAVPVSGDSGLFALRDRVAQILSDSSAPAAPPLAPEALHRSFRAEYIRWLLEYSGLATACKAATRPLKIVADAGNGCAGLVLSELLPQLPLEIVLLNSEPDGHFPNGVPNPLLPERREVTAAAVREAKADMGIAWDGDFDRCFFYDSEGNFIEGYYCIGLLAQELLRQFPGEKVVHDPRVYWNTREVVLQAGGKPVMGKTGHAFMKERMRAEKALYGGEMSAHHYFRDFAYCDSGMLPWMLVTALLCRSGQTLAELVAERMALYPCSGEINRRVANAPELMSKVRDAYASSASHEDCIDGVNLEFPEWRFNLRMSNTEPLLRLNVETRGNRALLEDKTAELLNLIEKEGQILPS